MATTKFEGSSINTQVHTKENILAKLNSNLTDSEKKSYFKILLSSPQTAHQLMIVTLEWKINLLTHQIKIKTLEETIRAKNISIDVLKELLLMLDTNERIESMQKSINKDVVALTEMQSLYEKSAARAVKSVELLDSLLDETTIESLLDVPKDAVKNSF